MTKFHNILAILFFSILIINGIYKYTEKGIYNSYSQWDLKTHIESFQWMMEGRPQLAPDQPQLFWPPYLPLAFPIFDCFTQFDWQVLRVAWLIVLCICIGLMILYVLGEMAKTDNLFSWKQAIPLTTVLLLFKGTFLSLAAGQISLFVIFMIFLFLYFQDRNPAVAVFALAVSTIKISLSLPFFAYLLLKRDYGFLGWSLFAAAAINLLVTFFYLGPLEHLNQLMISLRELEPLGVNSYLNMGASGRVDLAPFLALLRIRGHFLALALTILFIAGLIWIYRHLREMDDRLLLVNLVLLFFVMLYHRAYDLVLIVWLALPLIWMVRHQITFGYILLMLPLALPIQWIFRTGIETYPSLAFFWHFIGTSTAISIFALGFLLNRKHPKKSG